MQQHFKIIVAWLAHSYRVNETFFVNKAMNEKYFEMKAENIDFREKKKIQPISQTSNSHEHKATCTSLR